MGLVSLLVYTQSESESFLFVSESFSRAVDNCNIIDNHLFSDHVPLRLISHISVDYITVTSRTFSVMQAWFNKATPCDHMLDCDDQYCSVHKDEICINLLLTLVLLPFITFILFLLVPLK